MKDKIWIISQNTEEALLTFRIKRLNLTIYAYTEDEKMVNVADYLNEHEAVEAMRDLFKYLSDSTNNQPYKMKPKGFDNIK